MVECGGDRLKLSQTTCRRARLGEKGEHRVARFDDLAGMWDVGKGGKGFVGVQSIRPGAPVRKRDALFGKENRLADVQRTPFSRERKRARGSSHALAFARG